MGSENGIDRETPLMIIYSDTVNSGWGAISENNKTGGPFGCEENKYHIKIREILAAKFALSTFLNIENTYVKLMSDNTTTIYVINNMGCNKSDLCSQITFDIWS